MTRAETKKIAEALAGTVRLRREKDGYRVVGYPYIIVRSKKYSGLPWELFQISSKTPPLVYYRTLKAARESVALEVRHGLL